MYNEKRFKEDLLYANEMTLANWMNYKQNINLFLLYWYVTWVWYFQISRI